jgi:hypothetical protein
MSAPDVDVVKLTVFWVVYRPHAGEKFTGETVFVRFTVYDTVVVEDGEKPDWKAFAFSVKVPSTRIGEVNRKDVSEGSVPSTVYRIEAPDVDELNVTSWASLYVPAPGLAAGAATVP